eukprot:scaffold31452_cov112-Isochrysis_galbana.AAC.2
MGCEVGSGWEAREWGTEGGGGAAHTRIFGRTSPVLAPLAHVCVPGSLSLGPYCATAWVRGRTSYLCAWAAAARSSLSYLTTPLSGKLIWWARPGGGGLLPQQETPW